jgi:polar amino acid transport system substrate-binding protein
LLASLLIGGRVVAAKPKLTVAIAPDIPPYVMNKATSGIEVDIVQDILAGYTLHFIQLPFQELEVAVAQKRADVVVSVQGVEKGAFYSKAFISFANYAISKKAAGLDIERVADLKNHQVLAWQDAYLELGPAFRELFAPESPQRRNYVEVANQREQMRMFWQSKDAVIVIDRSIFSYLSEEMGHSMREVSLHALFPAVSSFKVGFKDAAVRDAFDRGLTELCQNGKYAKVLTRYHVDLPRTVCD